MRNTPDGVWVTMITPFTDTGRIDHPGVDLLVDWYIEHRVAGIFTVCLSSESFELERDERLELAERVVRRAAGRVPVVAGGNFDADPDRHVDEAKAVADTGVDAVVILTSTLASKDAEPDIWRDRLGRIVESLPSDIDLGLYECPVPFQRPISPDELAWCAGTNRFRFLKDTTCDIDRIGSKLEVTKGTQLRIFNAHTASLLASLQSGAAGYSSVMANVVPELYDWLIRRHAEEPAKARALQYYLTVANAAEVARSYPASAKYYLSLEGVPITPLTRTQGTLPFDQRTKNIMEHLRMLNQEYRERYGLL